MHGNNAVLTQKMTVLLKREIVCSAKTQHMPKEATVKLV